MNRKINVFTLLIFIYSLVVCITCKRDVHHDVLQISIEKSQTEHPLSSGFHADQVNTPSAALIRTSRN